MLQKLSDAPLAQCPQCSSADFRKKVSAAGFRLKGGGWYVTDFKNAGKNADKFGTTDKGKDNAGKADAAAPAADKPASDAKSAPESKPAAAAD